MFYGTNELTERGSYHVHFLMILRGGLNLTELHQHMAESLEFQDQFFGFYEDIIRHDLPEGIPFDKDGDPRTECLPAPPEPDAEPDEVESFLHQFEEEVKYCGELLQCHIHLDVCYKYRHTTCCFNFPHEYVPRSYYDKETQSVITSC